MPNPLDRRPASMRPVQTGSAASRKTNDWDQIDWPIVHYRVRRLQTRIAQATREQDWRRVKAQQRFLVNSFSAKVLAVKRVSENDGKRTPGVDGEVRSTPEAKWQAVQRLNSRGLRPQPLRRVYIPKRGSDKMRPLGIPAMIIRAQQALHLQGLEPVAETRADPHSYGFRWNRGTQDAIERVFTLLARKDSASWILEGDIKGCLDASSHYTSRCFEGIEEVGGNRRYLYSQAFCSSAVNVNGLELAALYTLQDRLPRDTQ